MKILKFPNKKLLSPTKHWDFSQENSRDKLYEIGKSLKETLEDTSNGAALAANQVGISQRIFAIREDLAIEADLPEIIVNPFVVKLLSGMETDKEGCLSFPGIFVDVRRFSEVSLVYWNIDGEKREKLLAGFFARVAQHECEHLDGHVFTENLDRITRFQIEGKMRKGH